LAERRRDPYNLDPELLKVIRSEFSMEGVVDELSQRIKAEGFSESIGKDVYIAFAEKLAKKVVEAGEQYDDLVYESIRKEVVDVLGEYYRFPSILQRFIEIAYLALFPVLITLDVFVGTLTKLSFRLPDCPMYEKLKEDCPEVAPELPCRHGCLALGEAISRELNFPDVKYSMAKSITEHGLCVFEANR
jgi:hypothetical protein